MILRGASSRLLAAALGLSVLGTGCGSLSKIAGGGKGKPSAARTQPGTPRLVSSFDVTADPKTGTLTFESAPGALQQLRGARLQLHGVRAQATPYTRAWDLNLSGRAVYNPTSHILVGDVTLATTSDTMFHNVKVIVTSISDSSVSVVNSTGITDLTGANKPYWSFGDASSSLPATPKTWQFNVPSGVTFRFSVALYADVWNTPPGDGGLILGLSFLNGSPSKGWAVGEAGKILYTADGGQTWSPQTSNVSDDLRDVCFVNAEQGWAVGNSGTLLTTSNGGKTWRFIDLGVPDDLNGVSFVNGSTGYIAGANGLLIYTRDGGASWNGEYGTLDALYDVKAIPTGTRVFAVGHSAQVLRSDDSGITGSWTPQTLPAAQLPFQAPVAYQNIVFGVDFIDNNRGWLVGAGGILFRTTNGGDTWVRQQIPWGGLGNPPDLLAVKFISPTQGWVTNRTGHVFATTDGGLNWTDQYQLPIAQRLPALAANSSGTIWVGGAGGTVLTLGPTTGGAWNPVLAGNAYDLTRVQFPSRNRGYAVGAQHTIMRSLDGGRTWDRLPDVPNASGDFKALCFVNELTGYVVGVAGQIYRTTDGGNNWTDERNFSVFNTLYAVHMIDANNGWAVGDAGMILHRNPFTGSWDPILDSFGSPLVIVNLNDVKFLPNGLTGFICGNSGTVLRTEDGGSNWFSAGGFGQRLQAIAVAPGATSAALKVWIVGDRGTLYRLGADGVTFQSQYGASQVPDFHCVDFIDSNRGWVVGKGIGTGNPGIFLQTTNGGLTWNATDAGPTRELIGVDFKDEDTGAVVGKNGLIKTFR